MTVELQSVSFRSPHPRSDAEFWGAVLDRPLEKDHGGFLLEGASGQASIRFSAGPAHGPEKNRLHLHLSDGFRDQSQTIAACLDLGARLLGNGHVPENSYAILADVVGDEFCVIEDGNPYLAGCGPLGEITCEGTRAAGLFWSRALGWPLVWEKDEETAIQSPVGGTKIAWSGDAVNPMTEGGRQYFVLTADHQRLDAEVERLLASGATRSPTARAGEVGLRDPDGNAFVLRASHGSAPRPRTRA